MSNTRVAALLAKAQTFMSAKTFRYPVCLNADRREELYRLRDAMETAANAAALAEKYPVKDERPGRRTIGDRINDAQRAVQELEQRAADILAAAEADDELLVVAFAIPEDAQQHENGPSGWYRDVKNRISDEVDARAKGDEGPSKPQLVLDRLPAMSFVGVQTPDGIDIGMSWPDVLRNLLDDADMEQVEAGVLSLYRGTTAVPFDPANFGSRQTS